MPFLTNLSIKNDIHYKKHLNNFKTIFQANDNAYLMKYLFIHKIVKSQKQIAEKILQQ